MHMGKTVIVSLIVAATTIAAAGGELDHKEKRAFAQKTYLDGAIKSIADKKQCGFAVDAGVQWDTFKFDDKNSENNAAMMCSRVLSEISFVCRRSADGKAAVQGKIKRVSCSYSETEATTISDGVVTARYGFGTLKGYNDRVAKALKDQL